MPALVALVFARKEPALPFFALNANQRLSLGATFRAGACNFYDGKFHAFIAIESLISLIILI